MQRYKNHEVPKKAQAARHRAPDKKAAQTIIRGVAAATSIVVAGMAFVVAREIGPLDETPPSNTAAKTAKPLAPSASDTPLDPQLHEEFRTKLRLALAAANRHARHAFLHPDSEDVELFDTRGGILDSDVGAFEAGTSILNDIIGFLSERTDYNAYINSACPDCCYDQCLIVEQRSNSSMAVHVKPNPSNYTVDVTFPHLLGRNNDEFFVGEVEPHRFPELIEAVSDLMLRASDDDFDDHNMAAILMRFGNAELTGGPYPPL